MVAKDGTPTAHASAAVSGRDAIKPEPAPWSSDPVPTRRAGSPRSQSSERFRLSARPGRGRRAARACIALSSRLAIFLRRSSAVCLPVRRSYAVSVMGGANPLCLPAVRARPTKSRACRRSSSLLAAAFASASMFFWLRIAAASRSAIGPVRVSKPSSRCLPREPSLALPPSLLLLPLLSLPPSPMTLSMAEAADARLAALPFCALRALPAHVRAELGRH